MEVKIAECFGIVIVERNRRYFIQYDSGGSASWLVENEINLSDVDRVKASAEGAHKVIIDAQKRNKPVRI